MLMIKTKIPKITEDKEIKKNNPTPIKKLCSSQLKNNNI